MKVINLYGGPGAGKSTTAAGLFHLMKMKHLSVELVNEFAKDMVWDDSHNILKDQLYIFANQNRKLERLRGKVDYVITDSPLLLSLLYMPENYPLSFHPFVLDIFHGYYNINIFINRVKPYIKLGRIQTEDQAKEKDEKLKNLLDVIKIYSIIDGDEKAPLNIWDRIK